MKKNLTHAKKQVNLNMKFRWLPWYSEVIKTDLKRVEVLQRVRKCIRLGEEDEYKSLYLGYVHGTKVEMFFKSEFRMRRPLFSLSHIFWNKEYSSDHTVILFADVVETEKGCTINIEIILNWFAALLIIPLVILPVIFAYTNAEPLLLLIPFAGYIITILFYNFRAFILYRKFIEAIMQGVQ
jgi:hypothetical protein